MLFLTAQQRGAMVGGLFALGALSIAGVPPAAGFIGKLEVFSAVVDQPALVAIVVLGSLLSFVYAFQIYQFEHWRPDPHPAARLPADRWRLRIVPISLGGLIVALGIWPEPLLALSDAAASVLSGTAR
jgi:multicomponent Na+:H+ antiporter subunit D